MMEIHPLIPVLSSEFTYKRVNTPPSRFHSPMSPISRTSSHLLSWTFSNYNPVYYVFETPYLLSKVLELEPDEIQENFGPRFSLFLLTLDYYFDEVSVSEFDAYSYDVQDNLALFHVSENADKSDPIMSYSSVETTTRTPRNNAEHAKDMSP